jgi:hypothetical protein
MNTTNNKQTNSNKGYMMTDSMKVLNKVSNKATPKASHKVNGASDLIRQAMLDMMKGNK